MHRIYNLVTVVALIIACGVTEEITTTTNEVVDKTIPAERNFTFSGGGRIQWNNQTEQVTFTDTITIQDHSTGTILKIEAVASPVTLTNINKVAYVSRNASESQSISELTTANSGQIPSASDDPGIIVLFHRTEENTIWVPWAQRELLSGDRWQFGNSMSFYERVLASGKPDYFVSMSERTLLQVPASPNSPAVVNIGEKLYCNRTTVAADASKLAPNGLDEIPIAFKSVYYVYAIPAESDRTFNLVLSTNHPDQGPSGEFGAAWSYLGSWVSNTFESFPLEAGTRSGNQNNFTSSILLTTSPITAKFETNAARSLVVPSHATDITIKIKGITASGGSPSTSGRFLVSFDEERKSIFSVTGELDQTSFVPDYQFQAPLADPEKLIWFGWSDLSDENWEALIRIDGYTDNADIFP